MLVGLTYDLRKDYLAMGYGEEETAEFDSESTIESLEATIKGLGHDVERIGHIFELTRQLAAGKRWDLVFNVTEGLHGRSREAQVPALLEAYGIRYTFSDPMTLALSLDKAMTKRVVRDAGIPTPWFVLIESKADLDHFPEPPAWPLFVKPVAEGTGKGVTTDSIVRNREALVRQSGILLDRYHQPVLVERFLPGREFTIGVLGTGASARAIGGVEVKLLERAEPGVYSFTNKELCEELVEYAAITDQAILAEASDVALRAYRVLGCRDAGRVDVKTSVEGRIEFIEINPLAGLHPSHSDLPIICTRVGIPYEELIRSILRFALEHPVHVPRFARP